MDEPAPVVSLNTTGSVGSRFVSQTDLDDAKKRKEEEWKAAYARLGQEPPPVQEEAEYDPRSLYEKLSAQKDSKREEWDDKMKMSNQWRGLEEDEVAFLRDTADEKRQLERDLRKREGEELAAFRAKQTKQAPPSLPSTIPLSASASPSIEAGPSKPTPAARPKPSQAAQQKKGIKGLVKGLVKKKEVGGKASGGSSLGLAGNGSLEKVEPSASTASTSPVAVSTADKPTPTSTITPTPPVKPTPEPSKRKRSSIGLLGVYSDSDSDSDGSPSEGDGGPNKKQKLD